MKIAFDLRRIANPGIGRYMQCLVEAILSMGKTTHRYLLIMPPAAADAIDAPAEGVERTICSARYYSLREQFELPWILRRHEVDLLHSPHFLLPLIPPCPAVVTIHDVIYLACKEDLPSRLGRLYYHAMMAAAVRLAKHVITDSEFSKRDIVRLLGADAVKIEVIYPGVSEDFQPINDPLTLCAVRNKHRIKRDYVLYTGIYKPRKNHAGLLRAFQRFLALGGDADLVIAGPLKEGKPLLLTLAGELGISARLKLTDFVNDDELRALYSGARLYACPSLYEGFGFTVLEAMACGAPVVCSAETSLPEVAGDAAYYANPRDPGEFGQALFRVFTDDGVRTALIAKGLENLKRFSWERAAAQTLGVLELAGNRTEETCDAGTVPGQVKAGNLAEQFDGRRE
jgi:glycosyltransferase involved in cell wall biosynthesis